jgi:very-short-patch-repair endonuclease
MAAVLAGGEGAALGCLAAAQHWQVWRRRPPAQIDVLTPRRLVPRPGVRFHRARHLDPRDVTVFRGIPVTTVPRTLVDLTDSLTAHQLANVIHEAAFRKRFNPKATRAAMQRANGRRNLAVLEQALAAHEQGSAGTRSDLEDAFLVEAREAGMSDALVNAEVDVAGGRIEVDFHWPDKKLCVEVDGPGHTRPRTKREDKARDRLLRDAGYEVLRFTDEDVERPGPRVRATLASLNR